MPQTIGDDTIANFKVLEPDDLTMIILVKLEGVQVKHRLRSLGGDGRNAHQPAITGVVDPE
jgi:hypothetical protein